MTDRELLELAAKAAGVNAKWSSSLEDWQKELTPPYADGAPWNPIRDNAQALQLAVKLGLSVVSGTYKVVCEFVPQEEGDVITAHEHYSDDPCAATRRAIVRAAAEIGKAK